MKYYYRGQSNTILNPKDRKNLIYIIVIVVLVIALAFSIITRFTGNSRYNAEAFQNNVRAIVTSEMRQALSAAEEISRSASSGTANTLSRLRQHVHALSVMNSMSILALGQGARIFPQQQLDAAQSIIDSFMSQLQTGQTIGEVLSKLMDALNQLQSNLNITTIQ